MRDRLRSRLSYTWDYENRLVQVVLPGSGRTVTFKYDPFGRRIQKVSPTAGTKNYLYDGVNLVEEIDASGTSVARYTQNLQVDEPLAVIRSGYTNFYQADGLGSVTAMADSGSGIKGGGEKVAAYVYDAFGNVTNQDGASNPFRYTGREFDSETGLYYYRARYYDSSSGRFLSEDPVSFGGGINFFAYVQNNPVNLTDPSGLKSCAVTALGYVCWADGNRDGGTIFLPKPPQNPIPNGISSSFEAFSNCANHIEAKCRVPAAPSGNPFTPPGGPKGDMGVTPNEGQVAIPQFDGPAAKACNCLKQYPLAALDPRLHFVFGDHNFLIEPGACLIQIF